MNFSKNNAVPLMIGVFSVFTLINVFFHPDEIYSILSILVGCAAIILFYRNNKNYDKLFYLWVFMQVPDIKYSGYDFMSAFPLNFGVGFNLGLKNNNYLSIYFNLLPIVLHYVVKLSNAEKSLGYKIQIKRLRKDAFPKAKFPLIAAVNKIAGRHKLTAIYLVELEGEIQIKEKTYTHILLEPKDHTLILDKGKHQVCGLRLCEDPEKVYNEKKNLFVDWVSVETLDMGPYEAK